MADLLRITKANGAILLVDPKDSNADVQKAIADWRAREAKAEAKDSDGGTAAGPNVSSKGSTKK